MNRLKKGFSAFMAFVIALSSLALFTYGAEENTHFAGNGYTVDYNLIHYWNDGYNAQIIITNTGENDIVDWTLTANANLGIPQWGLGEGVVLSQNDTETVITHQGWNGTIPVGGHITMWFSGSHTGTPPAPTQFTLTGEGLTGGGNNVGDENSEPSIVVLTPFPSGSVTTPFVDIEYIATPSEGETVIEVFYSINGRFHDYIFLAGGNGITPMGTFGQARVFIVPGVNQLEFTVRDSAGLTATYAMQQTPNLDEGTMAPTVPIEMWEEFSEGNGQVMFAANRLIIGTVRPFGSISAEQVTEIISAIDGTIVGSFPITGEFTIEVPANTEEGLNALGEWLLTEHPNVFRYVFLSLLEVNAGVQFAFPDDELVSSAGYDDAPFLTDGNFTHVGFTNFRTNDPWWDSNPTWNDRTE